MLFAQWLVNALLLYASLGAVFATVFVFSGIERIDPAAHGAPFGFRLLVIPGAAALWPVLLRRWVNAWREGR